MSDEVGELDSSNRLRKLEKRRHAIYGNDKVVGECPYCGGAIERGHATSESYERGQRIVLVRNIPCEKCTQCGETYLSDNTFAVVERQTEEVLKKSGKAVSILYYGGPEQQSKTDCDTPELVSRTQYVERGEGIANRVRHLWRAIWSAG